MKLLIAITISSLVLVTRGDNNNNGIRRKTRQETAKWYNDGWHGYPTYSPSSSSSIETTTDELQSHSQSSATTKTTEWPTYSPSNPPQYPSYSPISHYPTYSPSSITTHDKLQSVSSDTPSYSPTTHDDPPSHDPISDTPTYSPTANESSPSSTTSQKTQVPMTGTPSYSPTTETPSYSPTAGAGGVTSKAPTIPTTISTSNSNTDYPTEVIIGPAEINFINLSTDMITDNDIRLILNYKIGTNRQFHTLLYESDCTTPLSRSSGIDVTTNTPTIKNEEDGIYDKVKIVYTIDINNDTTTIESINMCVVFQLKNSEGVDVIMQEKRQVSLEIEV